MNLKKILFLSAIICNAMIYSAESTVSLKNIAADLYQEKITQKLKDYDMLIEREKKFIKFINDEEGKKYISIHSLVENIQSPDEKIKRKLAVVDAAKKATLFYSNINDDPCYVETLSNINPILNKLNLKLSYLPKLILNVTHSQEFSYYFQQKILYPDPSLQPSFETMSISTDALNIIEQLMKNFSVSVDPHYIGLLNSFINPWAMNNIRNDISRMVFTIANNQNCLTPEQYKKQYSDIENFNQTLKMLNQKNEEAIKRNQQMVEKAQQLNLPPTTSAAIKPVIQPTATDNQPAPILSSIRNKIIAGILSLGAFGGVMYYLTQYTPDWLSNLWNKLPTISSGDIEKQ